MDLTIEVHPPRCPLKMAETRFAGTAIAFAIALAFNPSSSNSLRKISPGCTGRMLFFTFDVVKTPLDTLLHHAQ